MRQLDARLILGFLLSLSFSLVGCKGGFDSATVDSSQLSSGLPATPTPTMPTGPTPSPTVSPTPSAMPTPSVTQAPSMTPVPPPSNVQLVPPNLFPIIGPLIGTSSVGKTQPLLGYDNKYAPNELSTYTSHFLPGLPTTSAITDNHYGALRSRVQWAIRNGLAFGPSATATTEVYGRGRQIVMQYLYNYSKPAGYAAPAHNNTGVADAELLWRLEGDQEAYNHICRGAQAASAKDAFGYYSMVNASSDARQIAISLQMTNAAHRMGIPFARCTFPNNQASFNNIGASSWIDSGNNLIKEVLAAGKISSNGSVQSMAHLTSGQCGTSATLCEAYFMSAMIATEFLRWHGFVSPNPAAFAAAQAIVDHLISEQARFGYQSLPYLSSVNITEAPDLAGFQVWPALVLWQETGQIKYKNFALDNLAAAQKAGVSGIKQFNQVYSTNAQTAEALLAGHPWK